MNTAEQSTDPLDVEAVELIEAVEANPDHGTIARFADWLERSSRHAERMSTLATQCNALRMAGRSSALVGASDRTRQ